MMGLLLSPQFITSYILPIFWRPFMRREIIKSIYTSPSGYIFILIDEFQYLGPITHEKVT
jgi:hypothetical protein